MKPEALMNDRTDARARQAKQAWGDTDAYREYEQKSKGRTDETSAQLAEGLMRAIGGIGALRELPADDPRVRSRVEALRDYITEHYYTCTREILQGLGRMYGTGGEMTQNIDRSCGPGTAAFAAEAIRRFE